MQVRPLESGSALARALALTIGLAAATLPCVAADVLSLFTFEPSPSAVQPPWTLVRFDEAIPATRYRVEREAGEPVVVSEADAAMALLARPVSVDLARTPVLCWRWRVDAVVPGADLTRKEGDDYAGRVYVAFTLPADAIGFGLRMKLALARSLFGEHVPDAALNYVWASQAPVGTSAPNAFTDRNHMLVLRSGNGEAGAWVAERRNVAEDFAKAFAVPGATVASVAIATDTDNTGAKASAAFAGLRFVAADESCSGAGSD